jgi:hypothetical protein
MKCNANKAPEGRNLNRKTSALAIKPQRGDILIVRANFKWGTWFHVHEGFKSDCRCKLNSLGSIKMSTLLGFRAPMLRR